MLRVGVHMDYSLHLTKALNWGTQAGCLPGSSRQQFGAGTGIVVTAEFSRGCFKQM